MHFCIVTGQGLNSNYKWPNRVNYSVYSVRSVLFLKFDKKMSKSAILELHFFAFCAKITLCDYYLFGHIQFDIMCEPMSTGKLMIKEFVMQTVLITNYKL